jgi:hypothetical protein
MSKHAMSQFTGTENYYRLWAFSTSVLTDGTKYVANEAGAYWLFEAIDSHLLDRLRKGRGPDEFVVAKLVRADDGAKLVLEDGNSTVLAQQDIEYTDFDFAEWATEDEFVSWAIYEPSMNAYVHLLPSEY